jgi:hypothetical protein
MVLVIVVLTKNIQSVNVPTKNVQKHSAHDIIQSGALINFIQNRQNQDRDM